MNPTPRTVWLMLGGIPIALLPVLVSAQLWVAWIVYACFVVLGFSADVVLVVPPGRLRIETEVPDRIHIGTPGEWLLRVVLDGGGPPLKVLLGCDLDPDLEPQRARRVRLVPGRTAVVRFALRARRRGLLAVDTLWVRWRGPLGLVQLTRSRDIGGRVAVVPDTATVRATALRFFSSPTAFAGIKTERFVGDGSEFESLRQYVPGLDIRSIDWKSSARHRRILCRRFRAERNHQVILAIDTGHLMSEPLDGVPRLDHAINRSLLLAYFCLRTGDRVGLYAFDAEPRTWLQPQGGMPAFGLVQDSSARLDYGTGETNFTRGALELSRRLKRRSLVVVFTEFVDTITAELMLDNLDRLARRHVVVFVALRDPGLEGIERGELRRLTDLNRAVVAAELGREREQVFRRLRRQGVWLVDALPDDMSMQLLNRYLEIKRRELV